MASFSLFLLTLSLLSLSALSTASYAPMTLTVVNNCPFTVWPAVQANSGHDVLEGGGFELRSLSHRSFAAPSKPWSGRIWARTGCQPGNTPSSLHCATGDCAGRLQCNGLGGAPPASLAQFSLHHGDQDFSSYGVSLVDGFNVGLSVTPHEGRGQCPVLACRTNLIATCPDVLQVRAPAGNQVVGCKSGCAAFNTDELCCRNKYNSPHTCRSSQYSEFFKRECPQAFTFAHDSPSLTHQCTAPKELKVIFCH
ncbi:pathogenesis-related thaumatin superfamily protein [Carex rostrata]